MSIRIFIPTSLEYQAIHLANQAGKSPTRFICDLIEQQFNATTAGDNKSDEKESTR